MDKPATLRDGVVLALGAVVLTVVLVFGIAGFMSGGQKILADRIDYNTQVTLVQEFRQNFQTKCIFTINPITREASDVETCILRAQKKFPLPKAPEGVDPVPE